MPITLIQDLRWGDSGKGKVSEVTSHPDACDISGRAVGGGNAGHVIIKDTRKIALHVLPAGCVHDGVDLVLGRGMVTHLPTLFDDAQKADDLFHTKPVDRLVIDGSNHILLRGHKEADAALEMRKGKGAIGTTGSGIGPAYADKALRVGMRMEDLKLPVAQLKDKYRALVSHWVSTYGIMMFHDKARASQDQDIADLLKARDMLASKVHTTLTPYWRKKFAANARLVIEGAQGSNLSIDSDGYPYVTSSATTVAGHMQGMGIPMREPRTVIGTLKAYDTRVGNGPMRTEMEPDMAAHIINKGGERGSTTGRERRPGWLDLEHMADRAYEEGIDVLAVLKSDVLDDEGRIPVAVGSNADGSPVYEHIEPWTGTRGKREYDALHPNLRGYMELIERQTDLPVGYIGTGPESSELVVRHDTLPQPR